MVHFRAMVIGYYKALIGNPILEVKSTPLVIVAVPLEVPEMAMKPLPVILQNH